jgi:DUF4097 and DUF4098 domain-containing protein YvlB
MLNAILIGALSVATFLPQTDTVVSAEGLSRLELGNLRGEVIVTTWDRNEIRIVADHSRNRSVELDRQGRTLEVEVEADRGMGLAGSVDFELTVPGSLDLTIEGMSLDVDIQGTEGQVEVTTINGPIHVRGGRGTIILESVNGEITVEDAQGSLEITGVAGGVTLRNCSGDIVAESVGGSLELEGITSRDVEVGTVGGSLRYEGSIEDGGVYTFGSHGGDIHLYLPGEMNARVEAVTLSGDMEVDFPGAPAEPTRGKGLPGLNEKELSFEVGTGSARIDVETFAGTIRILTRGRGG